MTAKKPATAPADEIQLADGFTPAGALDDADTEPEAEIDPRDAELASRTLR